MAEEAAQVKVTGMHCKGCEAVIEETLAALPCVADVHASFAEGTLSLRYDPQQCSLAQICQALEPKGYACALGRRPAANRRRQFFLALLGFVVLAAVIYGARRYGHSLSLPKLGPDVSDWLVLTVGLVTGFHCVGMCGGFVLSYTQAAVVSGRSPYPAHFLYGLGKTLSYSLFGALFGALGALISITPVMRGLTALIAGLFLLGFGLSMLGVLTWFRRLMIRRSNLLEKASAVRYRTRNPFLIGFFTGFLFACGPLQAMYVLAAGTASPWRGAEVMFLFGIGTLPALWGFGLFATCLSGRIMRHFFRLSGVLVILLGLVMMVKGWQKSHVGEVLQSLWSQGHPQ